MVFRSEIIYTWWVFHIYVNVYRRVTRNIQNPNWYNPGNWKPIKIGCYKLKIGMFININQFSLVILWVNDTGSITDYN